MTVPKLDEPDAYEVFLGGDYDKIDIRTTADSTDRLLLVKDSFADCMIPFLIHITGRSSW